MKYNYLRTTINYFKKYLFYYNFDDYGINLNLSLSNFLFDVFNLCLLFFHLHSIETGIGYEYYEPEIEVHFTKDELIFLGKGVLKLPCFTIDSFFKRGYRFWISIAIIITTLNLILK
ncbi:hypothetical protein ACTA71_008044 [Dictyostelium dimigraforme]